MKKKERNNMNKENETLEGKSLDELKAMLAEL